MDQRTPTARAEREGVEATFVHTDLFEWETPDRRTRKQLLDLFSPELIELDYEQELMTELTLPIGPTVLGQGFLFQRV